MKSPRNRDEPRRVESQARMTVADEAPAPITPLMGMAPMPEVATDPSLPGGVVEFRDQDGRLAGSIVNLAPAADPARPWQPIVTALQDGTLMEARAADGAEFMMVWRRTSRYNAARTRWEPVGFWSSHLSREPVKMEPVEWRLPEGFSMPGALVA